MKSALLLLFALPHAASRNITVAGYLPEWRYEGTNWVDVAEVVDQLILFSLEVEPSGRLSALDRLPQPQLLEEARLATRNAGSKLLICVGGNGRSAGFSRAVSKKASRALFVSQLVALCEKHDLDGVDLNWEYPGYDFRTGYQQDALLENDWKGLASVVRKLHQALWPSGRIVTMAYYPDKKQEALIMKHELHEYVTNLHMMAYDQPGRHSTWDFAARVAEQAAALLPPRLITLGLPFYGRQIRSGDWKSWEDLIQQHIGTLRGDPARDEVAGYYFNGPQMIQRKVELAARLGLGGVMIWEVGQDCRQHGFRRQNKHTMAETTHQPTCPDGAASSLLAAIDRAKRSKLIEVIGRDYDERQAERQASQSQKDEV